MGKLNDALGELREMDDLAAQDSPIHRLHPLAKLLATAAYIVAVASFGKYDLSGVLVMILYPALLFQLSGVSVKTCFWKLRVVLPLVMAVGLFNPLFDRAPMLALGGVAVSGGVISMLTLMLKGVLCLSASFLLIATTGIDALCAALRMLHVPGMLVTPTTCAPRGRRASTTPPGDPFWASCCCEAWTAPRSCTPACGCGAFTGSSTTPT